MAIQEKFPSIRPSLNLDFANTKTLDPRITFTRASTATYYDGKTFAKAEQNLLVRSQEFDNAAWFKPNATVTANTGAAPDGTTTADRLVPNTVTNRHIIYQTVRGPTVGSPITFSFFAKADGYDFVQAALCRNLGAATAGFIVNLTNGAVTELTQGDEFGTVSSFVQAVGNGWYRISITGSAVTVGTTSIQSLIAVSNAGTGVSYTAGSPSFAGDGTSGILVWGAQLEQRSTVTAYTPTTDQPITRYVPQLMTAAANTPRIDFDPVTGACRGLLIEEQRTNLLVRSQEFDNASWGKARVSITANALVAPDGTLTADKLVEDTSTSQHVLQQNCSVVNGTTYTYSVYVKAAEWTSFTLQIGAGGPRGEFNLSAVTATVGSGATAAAIVPAGNGWYRCSVTGPANASAVMYMYKISDIYTGDGTSGIFIWGAQLEAGAFPTSYIPTTTAQVTRSADSAVMTGTNFSSWYSDDSWTAVVEMTRLSNSPTGFIAGFGLNDNNYVGFGYSPNGQQAVYYVSNGVITTESTVSDLTKLSKIAASFGSNALTTSANGNATTTSTNKPPLTLNGNGVLYFGTSPFATNVVTSVHIRRFVFYPKALPSNLQALTA